ncbi:MAG: NADAR family protein [Muribaculaceae bacterium]|nr:NADAR family protein [Muribaculaceae bacterium]
MKDYNLGKMEAYPASAQVWTFKKAEDIVNGINLRLSNMAGGFPFEFNGITFKDSERLYLCGEWSNNTDEHLAVQEKLMKAKSGFAAKQFVKSSNKKTIREDFPSFRLQWMIFCVWQKCKKNEDFRKLLLSIPKDVILVENTNGDNWESAKIWGCKNQILGDKRDSLGKELEAKHKGMMKIKDLELLINVETNKINDIGVWEGQNCIGKILMLCRDCIVEGTEPIIDYDLLNRSKIYLFSKLLEF